MKLPISSPEYRKNERKCKKDSRDTRKDILETLESNLNKGMDSTEIAKILKLNTSTVRSNIKLLKNQKKIKVVGLTNTESPSGFCGLKYQLISSELPTVRVTKDSKRYYTLKRFYVKYNKQAISKSQAKDVIKKENLQEIPIAIGGKTFISYNLEDLKRVLFKKNVIIEENKPVVKEQQGSFAQAIKNFFKKKEKFDQDFISF
jgi:DNA-binding Lrp family transcriptional regulator